jgi:hypothetical protein|tara:strand:- start:79 stop:1320 length:1242 start_codon:yes stop_codon:yes gene_type:complete
LKTFKKYIELNEGVFDAIKVVSIWIKDKIKNAIKSISSTIEKSFSKLVFGKVIKTKLNYITNGKALNEAEDNIDLKSRLGYYSEFCTSYSLAKLVESNSGNLVGNTSAYLKKHKESYKKNKLVGVKFPKIDNKKLVVEIKRQEDSGVAIAKQLWEDIKVSTEDLGFVEFEIVLTGESGKGITKADIEFIARKKSTKEVIDHIEASLKAYKSWTINVSNSTFTSWIINLIDPELGGFSNKGSVEKKVGEFIKIHGLKNQMRKIQDFQSGPNSPAKLKKTIGREKAKELIDSEGIYSKVRDLMIQVFKVEYKKRKSEINSNFVKLLGFDGVDDLYLAVQTQAGGKVDVLSSRTSKAFNNILESLQDDFNIEFEKSTGQVNTSILFYLDKKLLFKSNFAFRDLDKVSQFVSFKDWS